MFLVAGLALVLHSPATHTATSRILLASSTAQSAQEADAVAAQARAIATSRAIVAAAITAAEVKRDATEVATKQVQVSALGTSPVVDVSVSDVDPAVALAMDNALAAGVVTFINQVGEAGTPVVLKQMQDQMAAYGKQLAALEAQQKLAPTNITLQNQVTSVRGLLTTLAGDYDHLLVDAAVKSTARSVSEAVAAKATPRHIPQRLVLAGLLGLVVGLLAAAVAWLIRPRFAGEPALREVLGAPVLGRLPVPWDEAALARVARGVTAAAARAGVSIVVLADPTESPEAELVARALDGAVSGSPAPLVNVSADGSFIAGGVGPGDAATRARWAPRDAFIQQDAGQRLEDRSGGGEQGSVHLDGAEGILDGPWLRVVAPTDELSLDPSLPRGLAFLAPGIVSRAEVEASRDLADATGWPVLGLVEVANAARGWQR